MADARREPFVAWLNTYHAQGGIPSGQQRRLYGQDAISQERVPVVVTPLLPDDPRPGETWIDRNGGECVVWSAPMPGPWSRGVRSVAVRGGGGIGYIAPIFDLTRPPVLKTFRVSLHDLIQGWGKVAHDSYITVSAESREAALAKLAEALEEVSDG